MRELTLSELSTVQGAYSGYTFNFIIENTITGCVLGWVFPSIPNTLGITGAIANPILASGALFGTYAVAKMLAVTLDNVFFTPAMNSIA